MVHALFMHPDLGIGGAERLVVDAGLALQSKGHRVTYLTNHHNPDHCFLETLDGTLPVRVSGSWLPRSIFGFCRALCAYIRMLYMTLYFLLIMLPVTQPDVVICDQIPIGIPFLKLFKLRVIFYCHFPDSLLSAPGGKWKRIYRFPINWIEEKTMSYADEILVNSKFTQKVFKQTFKTIHVTPMILHPSINTKTYDTAPRTVLQSIVPEAPEEGIIFLSINRYERKKNLGLAIKAMAHLKDYVSNRMFNQCYLIMAGGYDPDLPENVEHFTELHLIRDFYNLQDKVTFLKSPSDQKKVSLLANCTCVLYTPDEEHFGIVPLEAMYMEKPVIAVDSGGPTETVEHGVTGFLSDSSPEDMSQFMTTFIQSASADRVMGKAGKRRFIDKFSFDAFTKQLNSIVFNVTNNYN